MTKPNAPELKAIIDFCASHSTSESADLNKVLKMLIEYRDTRAKDVAAVDLDVQGIADLIAARVEGRHRSTIMYDAKDIVITTIQAAMKSANLHPEAAQEKQEDHIIGDEYWLERIDSEGGAIWYEIKGIKNDDVFIKIEGNSAKTLANKCFHALAPQEGGIHEYAGKLYSRRALERENAELRAAISKGQGAAFNIAERSLHCLVDFYRPETNANHEQDGFDNHIKNIRIGLSQQDEWRGKDGA